jgi:MoaA/NifB/PqqE/SkfB family radical SAM enzyme
MSILNYAIPPILQLETTTACNLGCPSCLRSIFCSSDESLSFDVFTRIIGVSKSRYLTLHGWGEPLLNPDLIEMIMYAAACRKSVNFTTNATLLADKADALIGSGLAAIAFSLPDIDRCTPEIAGNIRYFMERREASKSKIPKTHINIVLLEENIDQVEKMLALAKEFGVDIVTFERSFPWTPVLQEKEHSLFARISATARTLGCKVRLPLAHTSPCPLMRYTLFVRCNGDVAPCCYRADVVLGKIHSDSMVRIMQSRARFLKIQKSDPVCSACRV